MNYLQPLRTTASHSCTLRPPTAREKAISWLSKRLLPQACVLCEQWSGDLPVCAACCDHLPPWPVPQSLHCPCCGDLSASGDKCGRCLTAPPDFNRVIAPLSYARPVDSLIHRFKYSHQLYLAHWLADRMAAALTRQNAPLAQVIPMPLHPKRLIQRGFNQSAVLAQRIARRCRLPLNINACSRTRATVPQASLPYGERHANVRNAFECHADLTGESVILVDDVMTSGASVNEIARVLKLHGANHVTVLVAARTLHD